MRRSRAAALAAVVALHLLLWPLLRGLGPPPDRGTPPRERAPMVVQLLTVPTPPVQAERHGPSAMPAKPPLPGRLAPAVVPALQVPQAAALPPTAPAAAAEAPSAPPPVATPPSPPPSPSPPPLVLDLPRAASAPPRSMRGLALEDPRANTSRSTTVEARIGAVTGSTELVEEHLDNGRIAFRGNGCILTAPSRDGQLDPFNSAVSPRLRGATRC